MVTLAAMQLDAWLCSRIIFICRDRGGFLGGLLPVLPDSCPVRGEPVRRGAGKRCYGKSEWFCRCEKAARRRLFDIDMMLVCFGNFIFYRCF